MSYVEREADARLAAMRARAEAAEARLAQIREIAEMAKLSYQGNTGHLWTQVVNLAGGEEPA